MAVNPPYQIISEIGRMKEQTTPIWGQALQGLLAGINSYGQARQAKQDQERDIMKTFLTNYSVRPPASNDSAMSPTVNDIVTSLNAGQPVRSIPPMMGGMTAVPKMDVSALSHILPSVLGLQAPGKETPVSDIVEPGSVPGLKGDVTVTGKTKGGSASDSKHLDSMWSQAANAARASVKQMIDQANADPQSAMGASKFPILDAAVSHEQYLTELRKEAVTRGIDPKDIDGKVEELRTNFEKERKDYNKDLTEGLAILDKMPKERRGKIVGEVRNRLARKYPTFTYEINHHPDLK